MMGGYLCALFERATDPLAVDVEYGGRGGCRILIVDGNRVQHAAHGGSTVYAHGTAQRAATGIGLHMDGVVIAELTEHILAEGPDAFSVSLEALPGQTPVRNTARRHKDLPSTASLTIARTQNLAATTVALTSERHSI